MLRRRSELNNLEARLHDLRALKEEAAKRFLELHLAMSQDHHVLISVAGIAFTLSVLRALESLDMLTKTGIFANHTTTHMHRIL